MQVKGEGRVESDKPPPSRGAGKTAPRWKMHTSVAGWLNSNLPFVHPHQKSAPEIRQISDKLLTSADVHTCSVVALFVCRQRS